MTHHQIVWCYLPNGVGDEIHFTDYASTFDTNKIAFISPQNIQGRSTNAKCTIENATVKLIYQDNTKGWTADNITDDAPPFALKYLVVGAGGAGGGNWRSGGGGAGAVGTNFAIKVVVLPKFNYNFIAARFNNNLCSFNWSRWRGSIKF